MKRLALALFASFVFLMNATQAQDDTCPRKDPETQSGFLQPGEWWNLYFDESNDPALNKDPLKRSINAVKIIQLSETHRDWVQITFPKDRKEHFSIFGPAGKADRDPSIDLETALAEWERGVSEWKSVWINLDFVVHMSKVEPSHSTEPAIEPDPDGESPPPAR